MSFNKNIFSGLVVCLFLLLTAFNLSVLPEEVINFTGFYSKKKQQVQLTWQTVFPLKVQNYLVERAKAQNNGWDMLGSVRDLDKSARYAFTDTLPMAVNHYRLRLIDSKGKFSFSNTITVSKNDVILFQVYPVVVKENLLNLEGIDLVENIKTSAYMPSLSQDALDTFYIFNMLGQLVLSGKASVHIDISTLQRGMFIIKVGSKQARFQKE